MKGEAVSKGYLLSAYWSQSLRRSNWWSPLGETDGMGVLLVGNMFAIEAVAYTHSCPRCFTQTNKVTGDSVICGRCKLRSEPTYRVIRVLVARDMDEFEMASRLEMLAIRDMNPLALNLERTELDLTKWPEFDSEMRKAWDECF